MWLEKPGTLQSYNSKSRQSKLTEPVQGPRYMVGVGAWMFL